MELTSPALTDGDPIPGVYALSVPDAVSRIVFAANRNPALHWTGVPEGARSFALLFIDRDVPSAPDDVNHDDREVPADLPRVDFTHWVLIDLPPETRSITEAAFSEGVTPRGKPGLSAGPREGVNDYTGWFAGDPDMEGTYKGYDGPCPPWNDSIHHRYDFTLYALDVETLDVEDDFTADDVLAAMAGHILDSASLRLTYTLNPPPHLASPVRVGYGDDREPVDGGEVSGIASVDGQIIRNGDGGDHGVVGAGGRFGPHPLQVGGDSAEAPGSGCIKGQGFEVGFGLLEMGLTG